MRLNSMEENYRYKIGVVGSIPTAATIDDLLAKRTRHCEYNEAMVRSSNG